MKKERISGGKLWNTVLSKDGFTGVAPYGRKRGHMKQVQVLINEPEKAERLCHILSGHSGPFDLAKGSYTVDGKSILGICTMDLSAPLTLTIYGEEEDGIIGGNP